jgi:hypothetical protein
MQRRAATEPAVPVWVGWVALQLQAALKLDAIMPGEGVGVWCEMQVKFCRSGCAASWTMFAANWHQRRRQPQPHTGKGVIQGGLLCCALTRLQRWPLRMKEAPECDRDAERRRPAPSCGLRVSRSRSFVGASLQIVGWAGRSYGLVMTGHMEGPVVLTRAHVPRTFDNPTLCQVERRDR